MSLDFLQPYLDSRITFSRGSNATLVDATGKITYAPANLILQSQTFDNASWAKSQSTVTADATTAPDGTITADKLVEDSTTNIHQIIQSAASGIGVVETFSVYAKQAGRQWVVLQLGSGASSYFNLATGVVGTTVGGTATITNVGDGWYRCSITGTRVASNNNFILLASADTVTTYLGNGTSGVFIWGAQLEPVTYQTTPSPYVATTASAYYGPRFDYDPVTLAPKGLLIEEARTNLLVQSENFATTWSGPPITGTLTANATASPAGTGNATLFAPSNTAVNHDITQTVTAAAVSYTLSVYAKAQLYSHLFLQYFDGTTDRLAYFNLSTGAIGTTSGSPSPTITAVGNGWYRCTTTFTGVVGRNGFVVGAAPSDGGRAVAGNGTSGIYIWGAQLEQAAFATSYIPTVASTVTRSADVATMTGTNFSSWYNQSEGAFVAVGSINVATANSGSAGTVSDGTNNNRVLTGFEPSVQGFVAVGGVAQVSLLGGTAAVSVVNRIAFAIKANDFALTLNGATVVTDVSGTVPTVDRFNIGANGLGSGSFLNGHIRAIAYYNTRLPNAQLQTLTAPSLATTLTMSFTDQAYTVGV
jgi:hypothetical protein